MHGRLSFSGKTDQTVALLGASTFKAAVPQTCSTHLRCAQTSERTDYVTRLQ